LEEIRTKVLRVFLLVIQSHLYSFASKFLFLETRATSYSFSVQLRRRKEEKGGKTDRKPYLLPYGLRNPNKKLKSESSQDYAQKCTFMNSASANECVVYIIHGGKQIPDIITQLLCSKMMSCVATQRRASDSCHIYCRYIRPNSV
jgi:hypothetical protein